MDFSSDTSAPAHPKVLEALLGLEQDNQGSYGSDAVTAKLRATLRDLFEIDLDVWLVSSGTASNALALSLLCSSMGAVLCHEYAHIAEDERSASEFFTGGGKLHLLRGSHGKIEMAALDHALSRIDRSFVHATPSEALSLTNLTECGTAYSAGEISNFSEKAKTAGLAVHLDGARLANALVSTGASAAEMTWKSGIDIVTLGLTKCGAIGCELIILFGETRKKYDELLARAKRSGHMPPKMRYMAAQGLAMLEDDLWLKLAEHSNILATQTAKVFTDAGYEIAHPTHGNEVFVNLPKSVAQKLWDGGSVFYPWPDGSYRFVCAWTTPDSAISKLKAALTS